MSSIFLVSYASLWILSMAEALLVFLLYRHFGIVALGTIEGVQRDGLAIDTEAPPFAAVTSDGVPIRWHPVEGRQSLLLFASPDCQPCADILPRIAALVPERPDLAVVAVVAGPQEIARRLAEKFEANYECLADDGSGAFDLYRVRVTPFAFIVDGSGRIKSKGLCNSPDRLQQLLMSAAGGQEALTTERKSLAMEVKA
jgi:peroxiredoxin